jgi:hypothetical protein
MKYFRFLKILDGKDHAAFFKRNTKMHVKAGKSAMRAGIKICAVGKSDQLQASSIAQKTAVGTNLL